MAMSAGRSARVSDEATGMTTGTAAGATAVPRHVAVIMDGNGRWAKARGLPRSEGHRRGMETVRAVVRRARERGVAHLTLFSFSSENWRRPAAEVGFLMSLLKLFIKRDLAELHATRVRVRIIGERAGLPADIVSLLDEAERVTRDNDGLRLNVAFNYGSRQEIAGAARRLAAAVAEGRLRLDEVTPERLEAELLTAGIPDPDVIIRTSGEQRLSNFLLWQAAYSEFIFTPALWPDFAAADFDAAIAEFQRRDRRFGGVARLAAP
jgi:undecaprenyl diphosphate synthase